MKFLKTWMLAVLLSGVTSMALADGAESAWMPAGPVHTVAVSSSASTGEQVVATSSSFACTQYRLENTGGVDVWVGFGETAALAETNAADIPTAGDTGVAVLIKAGTAQVLSHGRNQYVSAKTASSTSTLYFGCGTGLANGVTGILLGTGTSSTSVQGPVADGAADTAAAPVEVGGTDGTNIQTLKTDSSGELQVDVLSVAGVTGAAADGAAASGNPVLTAGMDGSNNAQTILVDTSGRPNVVGGAAIDAPVSGNPVLAGGRANGGAPASVQDGDAQAVWLNVQGAVMGGGYDGSAGRVVSVDSSGRQIIIGAAAAGATAAGNPVLNGGVYTSNANQPAVTTGQVATLQTDPAGNLRTAPQRPTAADILAGSATVTATTGTTALVTVAAGRTVIGDLCISVAGSKAAANTGNGEVLGTALTVGTNVTPAAGTYFEVDTAIGANAATGVVGTNGSNSQCTKWTQASPAGNTTTLNYVTTCTNTSACRISVSFNGVMQ